ncbi:MAG: hypothetical protein ABEJ82_10425 [Haloplanus sp.]
MTTGGDSEGYGEPPETYRRPSDVGGPTSTGRLWSLFVRVPGFRAGAPKRNVIVALAYVYAVALAFSFVP